MTHTSYKIIEFGLKYDHSEKPESKTFELTSQLSIEGGQPGKSKEKNGEKPKNSEFQFDQEEASSHGNSQDQIANTDSEGSLETYGKKVTKAKRGTRVNTGGSDFEFGAGLKIFLKTEPGDGYDVYEDPFVKYSLLGAVQDNKFVESVEVRIKENLPESTFHQKYGMGSFN